MLGYLARGDVDFFRYSTDGMALLDLEVIPPERGGVEIEVTREDNTLLARAARSARHAPAPITGQAIPGGPILIRVVPRHGPIDSDDPYRLTVTSRPAPPRRATRLPEVERGMTEVTGWRLSASSSRSGCRPARTVRQSPPRPWHRSARRSRAAICGVPIS